MVRPVNFMSVVSPQHFCCEVGSSIRSNVVLNTVIVDKAFYESMDGSFGKSIACKEGKSGFK